MKKSLLLSYAISLLFVSILKFDAANALFVQKIEILGNKRISDQTIAAYMEIQEGKEVSESDLSRTIKSLYATGFFKDVKLSTAGDTVVIRVEEVPVVRSVTFSGNRKLETKDLQAVLIHTRLATLSYSDIFAEINAIKELYARRGFANVDVEYEVISDQESIDLKYIIQEGGVRYISAVNFEGNEVYKDARLRKVVSSKAKSILAPFSSKDKYDEMRIEYDIELLRYFYHNKGYYEFKVLDTIVSEDAKGRAQITFKIEEGDIFKVSKIDLDSYIPLEDSTLNSLLKISEGEVYSEDKVFETTTEITDYFNDMGYAFVDVAPVAQVDSETKEISLTFKVKESPRVYVGEINIKNNTRTIDKVIRREMRLDEGDPYNSSKLKRSVQNIKNLGYFSSVNHKVNPTSEFDRVEIEVSVDENSTGEFNIGAGYSTSEDQGVSAIIGLKERNFMGHGIITSLNLNKAQRRTNLTFDVLQPYFLDKPIKAGFKIFSDKIDRKEQSSYEYESKGFGLTAGYKLSEYLDHTLFYNYRKERLTDVPETASVFVRSQEGTTHHSSIAHSLFYNKLNDDYTPTAGYALSASQHFAGLGGDIRHIKHIGQAAYYKGFGKDKFVLKVAAKAGDIRGFGGKDVRLNDRFFLGQDDIRGFDAAGIGPRDKDTREALGGTSYITSKLEFSFPVGVSNDMGMEGFIFHDTAWLVGLEDSIDSSQVDFTRNMRASIGYGVKMNTPLGPLVIDMGYPYLKESFDKRRRFRLSYRTFF